MGHYASELGDPLTPEEQAEISRAIAEEEAARRVVAERVVRGILTAAVRLRRRTDIGEFAAAHPWVVGFRRQRVGDTDAFGWRLTVRGDAPPDAERQAAAASARDGCRLTEFVRLSPPMTPAWTSLLDSPPPAPGWYWAWDGVGHHEPVAMHYTGPGWAYVGRLGGTLEQVAWTHPWYWPVRMDPPATARPASGETD